MNIVCPSWSFSTKSCLLSTDGLYLPVADHVSLYCEGGGYLFCPQAAGLNTKHGAKNRTLSERRKSRRTPARLFARISDSLQSIEHVGAEGAAITVDLSNQGFRVELCSPLTEGTTIHFSLEDESTSSPVHGTGLVKWCHSMENAALFHAGIMVTDRTSASEIRQRIAQIHG